MFAVSLFAGRGYGIPHRCAICAAAAVILMLAMAPQARAGAVIELVPSAAGPYSPGQAIFVQIIVQNEETYQLPIVFNQYDFDDTDPAITLISFIWQLSPPAQGSFAYPLAIWSSSTAPGGTVPALGALQVATVEIVVPSVNGCYTLDVMNDDTTDPVRGARLDFLGPTGGTVSWRASTGELTGGVLGLDVGGVSSAETCNGLDDDCDGEVDEDFFVDIFNPATEMNEKVGPGDQCLLGEGECENLGVVQCTSNGLDIECVGRELPPGTEGPVGDDSCFDFRDNDCDGLTDHADPDCTGPEVCDGYDNDNDGQIDEDFPTLGDACTVGIGLCQNTGIVVCDTDGSGPRCNASAYPPSPESTPGIGVCVDGLDNDCDDLTDLADPDCQEPEKCDGRDNDGDGQVDEDFPDLGDACTVGLGPCQRTGVMVCTGDQTDTTCSASPGKKSPEGPAGCDCGDGIDNDCDGLTDLDDPDCGSAQLGVQCSLPYAYTPSGNDCCTWHQIDYQVLNDSGSAIVGAQLVAVDTNGEVLTGTPIPVQDGDYVQMASRTAATDFMATTETITFDADFFNSAPSWTDCMTGPGNGPYAPGCEDYDSDCDYDIDTADYAFLQTLFGQTITFHRLHAPEPFLYVHADDGLNQADAICSNIPQLHVVQPDDTITIFNQGNKTRVEAAIPNVDPASLFVKVDGVDVLTALGIDPATNFPGGPYGGQVPINGCIAQVCDLIVDTAPPDQMASNTLTMEIEGLCCGGHVVVVDGDPLAGVLADNPNPSCYIDELRDKGYSSGFEIQVTTPTDGMVTPGGPTTVQGEVCHGKEVVCPFDTICPPFIRLNGNWQTLGPVVVQPGDNEDSATTYRYPFNLSLQTLTFDQSAVPGAVHPGGARAVLEAWDVVGNAAFNDPLFFAVGPIVPSPVTSNKDDPSVDNALSLTISSNGLVSLFQAMAEQRMTAVAQNLQDWLRTFEGHQEDIDMPGALSDWTVTIFPKPETAMLDPGTDFVTSIGLQDGTMTVTTTLPDFVGQFEARGQYRIKACGPFGNICICIARLTLDLLAEIRISEAKLSFTINEDDFMNTNSVPINFIVDNDNVQISDLNNGLDIGCLAGFVFDVIDVILDIVNLVAQVLTLGQWNPDLHLGIPLEQLIEDNVNFAQLLGTLNGDPLSLDFVQLEDANFPAFKMTLGTELKDAQITPNGLALSWTGKFSPDEGSIDSEGADLPGTPLTAAPIPLPLIPMADQVTVGIADDFYNQLLFGLAANGTFKTQFDEDGTLNDHLPADCSTLPGLVQWGQCEGLKGGNCGALPPTVMEACGDAKLISTLLNIHATTPLLFHGRMDVAPKLAFEDDPLTPNVVEAVLRIDHLSVGLLADRDGDGVFPPAAVYDTIDRCEDTFPATQTTCELWEACLDVDFELALSLDVQPDGTPVINTTIIDRSLSNGMGCAGGAPVPGDTPLDDIMQGVVLDTLTAEVTNNTPPLEMDGLDFGSLVDFSNQRLIVIENNGDPTAGDYLGITGAATQP